MSGMYKHFLFVNMKTVLACKKASYITAWMNQRKKYYQILHFVIWGNVILDMAMLFKIVSKGDRDHDGAYNSPTPECWHPGVFLRFHWLSNRL